MGWPSLLPDDKVMLSSGILRHEPSNSREAPSCRAAYEVPREPDEGVGPAYFWSGTPKRRFESAVNLRYWS